MLYIPTFISIIEVLLVTVLVLLTVAFFTLFERETMASMQRRLGPNVVGYYGLLQAFADALKLLLNKVYSSLEWCLNSPPKPHSFVSLPLQSNITINSALISTIPVLTLSNDFFYLFSFNKPALFLGLQLGLDFNWDGLELQLSGSLMPTYSNLTIFCLSLSPVGFIGIIYLSSSLNLMDRQITNASSSISKEKTDSNTKPPMNLVCSQACAHGVWNFWSFVYNQKDPKGEFLNNLFGRYSSVQQTRYIDGVAYRGFLFRPPIGPGQGEFSKFNFLGTEVKVNLKNFIILNDKYNIYSGEASCNPPLPKIGDTLFIRQFYDKAHVNKEDSYISDYESLSDEETASK